MILTILQAIAAWVVAGFLMWFSYDLYRSVTTYTGAVNVFDVAREILGGYILAYVLWYERGMYYGE